MKIYRDLGYEASILQKCQSIGVKHISDTDTCVIRPDTYQGSIQQLNLNFKKNIGRNVCDTTKIQLFVGNTHRMLNKQWKKTAEPYSRSIHQTY